MASSGSATTSSSSNRSLTFEWWVNSQSVAENYTEIGWKVYGSGSYTGYVNAGPFELWIAGEQFYNGNRIQLWQGTEVLSGTKRIGHNSDGSGSFAAYLHAAVYSYSYNVDFSETSWGLPSIPRAPSYTSINASSVTESSVRLTGSVDTKGLSVTGGGWDISTNGGSSWTYYSGGPTDKTITDLNPGTQYWYRGYVTTSGGGANSGWGTFTTKDCVIHNKINDTWEACVPYIKVNGIWKKAIPYMKVNGSWKEGIN